MQKTYLAPELKLAGEADQLVLGGSSPGTDIFGDDLWDDTPNASDEDPQNNR